MNTAILLTIQRAIARKLTFYQWWKEQSDFPHSAMFQKDRAQITYNEQEELLKTNLKRFKEVIVTDERGWPPEHFQFIIHTDTESAAKHGRKVLGKGRFRIIPWTSFKHTPPFRTISHRIAMRERHQRHKPKPITHAPIPEGPKEKYFLFIQAKDPHRSTAIFSFWTKEGMEIDLPTILQRFVHPDNTFTITET